MQLSICFFHPMGGGGSQLVVIMMALFVVPKLMSIMPDFDPLMVIVGLFVILALVQQLGFQQGDGANANDGEGTTARARQRQRQNRAAEEEQDSSSKVVNIPQLLKDAERALEQNSWSRVQELAKRIADADPENARAWELLATAQKWDGQRDAAAATVKKAQEVYEVNSAGLRALAKELSSSKPSTAMVGECEKKGEDFIAKRQYDLASECYAKALAALGESPEAQEAKDMRRRLLRRHAECAQQLQDWTTCRHCTTELLEVDPRDKNALLQRAASNEALEKFKAALEDARMLLALEPSNRAANRIVNNCRQALAD